MKDTTFFQAVLGATDPWRVEAVELDTARETVTIELGVKAGTIWGCPVCQKRMHVHGWERRRWRHLDTQQLKTWVEAEVPTVRCEEHGAQQVRVPWAEPYSRFTMLFEELGIALLQGMTTAAVTRRMGISWDEADGIKQRAVRRGRLREPVRIMKHLRVDEKHAGYKLWLTIVSCVDDGKARVVYVAEGRDQETLDAFWHSLTDEQLAGIESVAMDMSEAYTNSVFLHVPGGRQKLVYDRYHVAQQMNKAVDEVRRSEQAAMATEEAKTMKGSRYWWLYHPKHLPRKVKSRFRRLQDIAHKTAKAWEFKELLREFWNCPDRETGHEHLREWLRRALRSCLQPVAKVARMCKRHIENLLTFFAHRSTNASAEAVNSRIQSLINQACGYRNPLRLITEIFFHYGDLDLVPRFPQ
jgi:transposase